METFSSLLALCAGNSPVTGEFPAQRPVTRSFDVFFDLSLNKRLSKQPCDWWFETPSRPLWRHSNGPTQPWRTLLIPWLVYIALALYDDKSTGSNHDDYQMKLGMNVSNLSCSRKAEMQIHIDVSWIIFSAFSFIMWHYFCTSCQIRSYQIRCLIENQARD